MKMMEEEQRSGEMLSGLDDFADVLGEMACQHHESNFPELQEY
jgi:hypothetical protein